MIPKAPCMRPAAPIPAIARPPIKVGDEGEAAHSTDPTTSRTLVKVSNQRAAGHPKSVQNGLVPSKTTINTRYITLGSKVLYIFSLVVWNVVQVMR